MSSIPKTLQALFRKAFEPVLNTEIRTQLEREGWKLFRVVWERHIQHRTHSDNRKEHEVVVLRNFFEITAELAFTISELRVGLAACLLHDTCFIPRITEAHILAAKSPAKAEKLRKKKERQRRDHMIGSARNAKRIFAYLAKSGTAILSSAEILRCVGLVALHDLWKLGFPWPAGSDWLAVCFVEADALWPVSHPFGPLADLQRDNGAGYDPVADELRNQAIVNRDTQLVAYRRNFKCTAEQFQDNKSIIRTTAGARILARYSKAWGI
jgi:hypothetical protein